MELVWIFLLLLFFFLLAGRRRAGEKEYEQTEYYIQTKNAYRRVLADKGLFGEYTLYQCLEKIEGHKQYLFNLYLPKEDGETTELDVVFLHESGIYILESKNYSGFIFGSENQQNWTQTLRSRRGRIQKVHFFNPVLQNKVHIKWLRVFLGEPALPFYSYIVFSDRCTLKQITLTSGEHVVLNRCDLSAALYENIDKAGTHLSPDEIDALYEKLYPFTQVDSAEKLAHAEQVERKKQQLVPKKVCPRCGGRLVVRTASKGSHLGQKFMGCSNYPRCHYIEELQKE